jgi:NAD(P)-dependent dehydrogenase (short-subunit alcohol dehydrogenase family)
MSRIFITGSTDGLGLMAAVLLVKDGHRVTLHARNQARAAEVRTRLPGADAVVIGDLSATESMRAIAEQVNALGRHDAVIHNAGVGYREPRRIQTADGLSHVFAINVLAPYLLTALITRPRRLVYLSSGMHTSGDAALNDPQWESVAGTARKRTPTASSTTSCWPSPSHAAGLGCVPMRSHPGGCLPRWAAREHPMTFHSRR